MASLTKRSPAGRSVGGMRRRSHPKARAMLESRTRDGRDAARAVRRVVLFVAALTACLLAACAHGRDASPVPRLSKVAVLFLENRGYHDVIGSPDAPFLNRLARRSALETRYYALGHPSLPNYLALITGSTQGVTSDCNACEIDAASLPGELERGSDPLAGVLRGDPPAGLRGQRGGRLLEALQPVRLRRADQRRSDRAPARGRVRRAAARPAPAQPAALLLDHARPPARRPQRLGAAERPVRREAGAARGARARTARGPVRHLGRGPRPDRAAGRAGGADRDRARRAPRGAAARTRRSPVAARDARGGLRLPSLGAGGTPLTGLLRP